MNIHTIKKLFIDVRNFPQFVLIIFLGLSSLSCASSTNGNFSSDSLHKENDNYLSFYEGDDGKTIHWEVNFKNEEIASIYRDGEKIPAEDIDEYRSMINEKLDEIRFGLRKHSFKMDHFAFDMDEFHDDMEKLKEQMHYRFEYLDDFKFDEEEFNKNMEELQKRLGKLKDRKFNLNFDSEKFKEQMEKLNEQFKEHEFNFDFDFDADELKEIIESYQFNFDDIDINLEDFEIQMEKLNKELDELDLNLEDLDEEMEKLDAFIDELKAELVIDGYLGSENEEVKIKISSNEMYVDGKKVPAELLKKYKEIYKNHMGKDMRETSNIHIH